MSPVNVPAIGAYIREQREQAKISLRQLAQATGVSNPYLSQIERGLRKPSADILQQLAKGLRISAEALYVQAGFLEDKPEGYGVREAVLAAADLTERQKQMLLEIYDSFRNEAGLDAEEAQDGQSAAAGDAGLDPAALTWPELAEGNTAAMSAQPVVEEAVLEEAALEQVAAEQTAAKQTAAKQTPAKQTAAKQTAAKQTPAKQTPAKQTPAKQTPAEQTAAEQTAAEQTPAEKTAHEPAAAQATPKRTAPRRATAKTAASRRAGSKAAAAAEPKSGSSSGNRSRAGRARPSTARTR